MQNTPISSSAPAANPAFEPIPTAPCLVRFGEVPLTHGPGETGAFLLKGENTGGRITLSSAEIAVNAGPPAHIHGNEDEIFLIQSGAFEILADGKLIEARAGDVVFGARGEAHRFRGLDTGEPNRFNIVIGPSGFENFMARWVRLFENGAPDMEAAMQLCGEYGIALFPSDDLAPVPTDTQSKLIRASERPLLSVMGCDVQVLLSAEDTQGRYSLIRISGTRDAGPPPHIHTNEDEVFIVEAGQVEFLLGDKTVLAEVGDVVWAPRGFAHTFRLASDDARFTALMTPGGFDQFFTECALTELAGEATPATIDAICKLFGIHNL